jgi:hypothetical protein
MIKYAIRCVLAALPLFAATAVIPAPAHACNILNPPIACANLPGSNPVSGLGTLFQNQFQSVPGSSPGQSPDGGFFVEDRWQLNDRWSFGQPRRSDSDDADAGISAYIRESIRSGNVSVTPELGPFESDPPPLVLESDDAGARMAEYIRAYIRSAPFTATPELGRVESDPPRLVLESDNADVERGQDSIMDDLEGFFVKM